MEPIKEAFRRLSRFGATMRERALPVWKLVQLQCEPALQWLKLRPRVVFWASGIGIALAFLVFSGATAAGAALLAWAALRQAQTASERHQEQTNADRQRRITESFAKAVEQLGSDKLEVRLGGIYSLERISKESPDDYWTVMENLTAFVRNARAGTKPSAPRWTLNNGYPSEPISCGRRPVGQTGGLKSFGLPPSRKKN
jgi:hypothetical protein